MMVAESKHCPQPVPPGSSVDPAEHSRVRALPLSACSPSIRRPSSPQSLSLRPHPFFVYLRQNCLVRLIGTPRHLRSAFSPLSRPARTGIVSVLVSSLHLSDS